MLWKEILSGFLLAGFIALLGDDFFNGLFLDDAPAAVQTLWGAVIGPVIAVLSFVCSVGNVPLAAVLWSGGLSFAGVMAFIFADLIVLPIILAYRKYYGTVLRAADHRADVVTMILAALVVDLVFSALGLIPDARPTTNDVFGSIQVDYKLVLNVLATLVFVALIGLTVRRGAIDPVCGMTRRPGHRAAPRARRPHALLLLRALPRDVRGRRVRSRAGARWRSRPRPRSRRAARPGVAGARSGRRSGRRRSRRRR